MRGNPNPTVISLIILFALGILLTAVPASIRQPNRSGQISLDTISLVFWSVFLIIGAILAYVLYSEIRLQLAFKSLKSRPVVSIRPKSVQPNSPLTGKQRSLHTDLMILLRGDEGAAKRLLRMVVLQNPGRSLEWCYEKVIWDLERDRRR